MMQQTPFKSYFHLSAPVDGSNVGCGAQRVDRYMAVQDGSVTYTDTKVTLFTFETFVNDYNQTRWNIYTEIDGTKYYLGLFSVFSGNTSNVLSASKSAGLGWICYSSDSSGNLIRLTKLNQSSQPIFISYGGDTSFWMFAYTKDIFGSFSSNDKPYADDISGTPITTGSPPGSQVCNYYVWFD